MAVGLMLQELSAENFSSGAAGAGEVLTADGAGGAVFRMLPAYVVIAEPLPGTDLNRPSGELTNVFEMNAGFPPRPGDRIHYRVEFAEAVGTFLAISMDWSGPTVLGEM